MKRALYIGIYTQGTTSRMRAEQLQSLLNGWSFKVIDTDIPFFKTTKILRSLGFKFKIGPLLTRINRYILSGLADDSYDLIWVDKAIYLTESTTKKLRTRAGKLFHYTPDAAFFMNASGHFNSSVHFYDFAVTTKSFEIEKYKELTDNEKIVLTTQAFNADLHKPTVAFEEKKCQVAFVGLNEPSREEIIQSLLDHNIKVSIAGLNWEAFARQNESKSNLKYIGNAIWGNDYVRLLSESLFGLGLVSKRFPELHTTRTLEIPACGTALVTERNCETEKIFNPDEVIFFSNTNELIQRISFYQENLPELKSLTQKGHSKVLNEGYDYKSILRGLLQKAHLIPETSG